MTNADDAVPEFVDWDLATATAKRLAGSGPSVTESEARTAVADLKRFSEEAQSHVQKVTGLDGSHEQAPVAVVDRAGWASANAASMRTIIRPLAKKLNERRSGSFFDQIGPKVTGLETGALLAFLASKVLGQFDPFWTGNASGSGEDNGDGQRGRLLLVAPNVVHVERELDAVPSDFRLWVCLHEETHRVQFTAVPWLRDHLSSEIQAFVDATDLDAAALGDRVRDAVRAIVDSTRGEDGSRASVLELVQSPEQRAVVERVTAVMSLLEGHADVVMDAVGPEIVPTVETIRRRFQKRRRGTSGVDRTVRRMLGLEAKMRQYKDGAAFVNAVVDAVGMDGLNRVWESSTALPTKAEIADPSAWVQRVHGAEPATANDP